MKKFLLVSVVVVVVSLFFLTLAGLYLKETTGRQIALKRQAIADTGDKVYLSDYAVDPIPADQDGLAQFELASEHFDRFDKDHITAFPTGFFYESKLNSEQIDSMEQLVADFPAMFEQLDRAAQCTQFVGASSNSNDPMDALSNEVLQQLRTAVRAYSAKALVAAYRGKGDEALRICDNALKLQQVARVRPTLVSCLVEAATQSLIVDTANHVLRVSQPSSEAIAQFNQTLSGIDNIASLTAAMKGERAFGLSMITKVKQEGDAGGGTIPGGGFLLGNWLGDAYLNDDEEMYLDLMAANIEVIGEPKEKREVVLQKIENELTATKFRYAMSRMLVPSLSRAHDAIDRIEAKVRCLRMICDNQEAFQKAESEPLVNVPLDPFDGSPMKSKQTKDGWVVYSVGENLEDDGGDVVSQAADSRPLDIGLGPLLPMVDQPAVVAP